jgi:hypothetical protein
MPAPRFNPIARTGTTARGPIAGIRELTAVQGEAATTDAFGKTRPQALELADTFVDACGPPARQRGPIRALRHTVVRELGQFRTDLLECQADSLCEDDERDAANNGARVAPVPGAGALRVDEPLFLVEAKRRGCDPAPLGYLSDGQDFLHKTQCAESSA